ncbi:MAG TPA: glycosyltransferase family 1 protein, partial [Actinomycetota bacterium]|nr:glycosyltransferase family 1 protein [Actinomycetota bacterium]
MKVAVTIEQCWHEIPGGTAVAALGMARGVAATGEAEVVGVSASHRGPPPDPWVPPFEVRSLPLPRIALYESWHRLRAPAVERATGPVDV